MSGAGRWRHTEALSRASIALHAAYKLPRAAALEPNSSGGRRGTTLSAGNDQTWTPWRNSRASSRSTKARSGRTPPGDNGHESLVSPVFSLVSPRSGAPIGGGPRPRAPPVGVDVRRHLLAGAQRRAGSWARGEARTASVSANCCCGAARAAHASCHLATSAPLATAGAHFNQ